MSKGSLRPMLACNELNITYEDLKYLKYPIWISEKFDGIRCLLLCRDGKCQALSRALKPIPNFIIQQWAEDWGVAGLDGELILPGKKFHDNQSYFMTRVTAPRDWKYMVFDFTGYPDQPFLHRVQTYRNMLESYKVPAAEIVRPIPCKDPKAVIKQFEKVITDGGEGLILRSPMGKYKFGRATYLEGTMYKMKQFEDSEGVVIDCFPLERNYNEPTRDKLGLQTRSSHKANRITTELLGAFRVRDINSGKEFNIGSGYNADQRKNYWKDRRNLLGKIVSYRFQVQGVKDKPRTPIFVGIRLD